MAPLALRSSASAHWSGGPGPTGPEKEERPVRPVRPEGAGGSGRFVVKLVEIVLNLMIDRLFVIKNARNVYIFSENGGCNTIYGVIVINF